MKQAWLSLHGQPALQQALVDPDAARVRLGNREFGSEQATFEVPTRGAVYGTALNFRGALAALGSAVDAPPYLAAPRAPVLYIKPRNTWIGHGAAIPLPERCEAVAVGPTLGLVIGSTATRVSVATALDHIAGYTVVNDIALPHTSYFRPAIAQQCRDGFCPIGPWILARDAVPDPDRLEIRVHIDGELRLRSNTVELIRPVRQLLSDVSAFMTLQRGDLLLVGLPENLPLAHAQARVSVEIAGIGRLENTVLPAATLGGGR